MPSSIDPSVIGAGDIDKAAVRLQFERARDEISALQIGTPLWAGSAGGAANALTLTLSPAITGYTAGQPIAFIPIANNTGATTLNVNGRGAVSLRSPTGIVCIGGELLSNRVTVAYYDGANWRLLNLPLIQVAISSASGGNLNAPAGSGTVWSCAYAGYASSGFTWTAPFVTKEIAGGALVEAGVLGTIFSGVATRKA